PRGLEADFHADLRTVDRVVPRVPRGRLLHAIPIQVNSAPWLVHARITGPRLASGDLVAVIGAGPVAFAEDVKGTVRPLVADGETPGVVRGACDRVVKDDPSPPGNKDGALRPERLQADCGEGVVIDLGTQAAAQSPGHGGPVDLDLRIDDRVVPDHDPR